MEKSKGRQGSWEACAPQENQQFPPSVPTIAPLTALGARGPSPFVLLEEGQSPHRLPADPSVTCCPRAVLLGPQESEGRLAPSFLSPDLKGWKTNADV